MAESENGEAAIVTARAPRCLRRLKNLGVQLSSTKSNIEALINSRKGELPCPRFAVYRAHK